MATRFFFGINILEHKTDVVQIIHKLMHNCLHGLMLHMNKTVIIKLLITPNLQDGTAFTKQVEGGTHKMNDCSFRTAN
jgi:hypothetical protein